MATSTAPYSTPKKKFARLIGFSLIVLVLFCLSVSFWLRSVMLSALPQLDGTAQIRGLSATVVITRDTHGLPTINASNLDDLFFAQGYVTAEDRLFQMDGMRRFAAGELSEVVGDAQLEHDKQQRILGLRVAA